MKSACWFPACRAARNLALTACTLTAFVLRAQYDLLPADRVPPAGWVEPTWTDPGSWVTVNVTAAGLPVNDSSVDAAAQIAAILAAQPAGQHTKLYFPTGSYYLQSRPTISVSNVWITGDGMDKTVFKFAGTASAGFLFKGADTTTFINITTDVPRGAQAVTVAATDNTFAAGDWVEIDQANSGIYDNYTVGQITQVAAAPYVSGANKVIPLGMKLGLASPLGTSPRIRKLSMISNLRFDQFTIDRTGAANSGSNLYFGYVNNLLVDSVHSIYGAPNHIDFSHCYQVVASRDTLELATDYGKGGAGYGFTPKYNSTWGVVKDCVLRKLRHSVAPILGANHFIISNNTFSENMATTGTIAGLTIHGWGAHNNLVQLNYAADPAGRSIEQDDVHDQDFYNAFLRNYATGYIGDVSRFDDEYASMAGNKVLAGSSVASIRSYGDRDRTNYWSQNQAYTKIEATAYTATSGVTVATCNDAYESNLLTSTSNGDWVSYAGIDFTNVDSISIRHCVGINNGGTIELRLDSATGTLIGSGTTTSTGGWGKGWTFLEIPITATAGTHTLYLRFIPTSGIVAQIDFLTLNRHATSSTTLEAEAYGTMSGVVVTTCSEGGNAIGSLNNGDWIAYNAVDLSGVSYIDVRYACAATGGGVIEVRLGSPTGTKIGEVTTASTGGWDSNYQTAKALINPTAGVQALYFVFTTTNAAVGNINNFKLMRPTPFVDNTAVY